MEKLVEKLRIFIFTHDIKREGVDRSNFNGIIQKRNEMNKTDDGTYNLYTKEAVTFDRGYQVSFQTEWDPYNDTEYEDIAYKMSLLSDNSAYIGVFSHIPEISFHFDDIELANTLSILFDQFSIWDWSISGEIVNPYFDNKTDENLA